MNERYNTAVEEYKLGNFKKALAMFSDIAKNNDSDAQKMVANMLVNGIGTKRDEEEGYKWYLKAAENGDEEAMFWIAMKLLEDKRIDEGLEYLSLSSKKNYPEALFWLGNIYRYGMYSQNKDLDKAKKYYENALKHKCNKAKNVLLKTIAEKDGKFKALIYAYKNKAILMNRS